MPNPKKPKNKNKRLPVNVPATMRCIPVSVPDDPEYFALFIRKIQELAFYSTWEYDPATLSHQKASTDLWRTVADDVQQKYADGTVCETGGPTDPQDCKILLPSNPAIGWFPNHPFLTPDQGFPWPAPAWINSAGLPGLGEPSDVLIRIDAAPFFTDLGDLLASGVPSWTLYFSGEAEVDVRFRRTLFGGFCWVFPDGNPLLGLAIDLEWRDLSDFASTEIIEVFLGLIQGSLIGSTVSTTEIQFTTPGSHTLTAWYFPKVQATEWPPVGWGGGLASIQLCGDSVLLEDAPLDYTLDCNSGVVRLLLDENPVSTIDLAVCGVVGPTGPTGPAGADGADGADGVPGADGEDAVMPYTEIEYNFDGPVNANKHWEIVAGTWTFGEGVVSVYALGDQAIAVAIYPEPGVTVLRVGAEWLASSGAEGVINIHQNSIEVSDNDTVTFIQNVTGPETVITDQPLGWHYSDGEHYILLTYFHAGADSGEIVTLRKVNLIVSGYPNQKMALPVISDTTIWGVDHDYKTFSHLE